MNTPIVSRLRARAKALAVNNTATGGKLLHIDTEKEKTKGKRKGKRKNKTTEDENPQSIGNSDSADPGRSANQINMEELKKHMEMLQKKSEESLKTLLKSTLDKNKSEMDESLKSMISTLKSSIGDVKSELSNIDQKYNARLELLETKVEGIDKKITKTNLDMESNEQSHASVHEKTKGRIHELEEELKQTRKYMDKRFETLRQDFQTTLEEQGEILLQQGLQHDFWKKHSEDEIDALKVKTYGNTNQIKQQGTMIEGIDSKVRASNIIVEGLPEPTKKEENDKQSLMDVLRKAIPDFQENWITTIIRLGQIRKKRPRLLLVCLSDPNKREFVLKKAQEMREKSENKFLRINRDQNDNSKRRHSLIKSCYNLLLKNKYAALMKGSVITYNKKQYDYDMLNMLPDSCTPFVVKTRETTDKKGLCFSSEHTYCSNFYPSKIKYKSHVFTSVEHGFQYLKVKDAGYLELAAEMTGMTDPYKIKNIGDGIKAHKDWKDQEEELMEKLIKEKFIQNKKIREKLIADHHDQFFEMNRDVHWGTGSCIAHDTQLIDTKELKGKNKVGLILGEIKSELSDTGRLTSPRETGKDKGEEEEEEELDTESSGESTSDEIEAQPVVQSPVTTTTEVQTE